MDCALHRRCGNPADVWAHVAGRPMLLCMDCLARATRDMGVVETHWNAPLTQPCPPAEHRVETDPVKREATLIEERARTMAQAELGLGATQAEVAALVPHFRKPAKAELDRQTQYPDRDHPKRTTPRRDKGERAAATPRCSSPAVRSPATRAQSSTGDAAQAATGGVVPLSPAPSPEDAPGASVADGTTGAGAAAPVVVPVPRDASAPEVEAVVVAEASGAPPSLPADPPPVVVEEEAPPVEPTPTPTQEPTMPRPVPEQPALRPNADAYPELCRVAGCKRAGDRRGLCGAHVQGARKHGWLEALALPPKAINRKVEPKTIVAEPIERADVESLRRQLAEANGELTSVRAAMKTAAGMRQDTVITDEDLLEQVQAAAALLRTQDLTRTAYAFRQTLRYLVGADVEDGQTDTQLREKAMRVREDLERHRKLSDGLSAAHIAHREALMRALGSTGATLEECVAAVVDLLRDREEARRDRAPVLLPTTDTMERAARFRRAVTVALGGEDEAQATDGELITSIVRLRTNLDTTQGSYRELSRIHAEVRDILAGADPTIMYVAVDDLAAQLADRHKALRAAAEAAGAPVGPTPAPASPRAVELAAQLGRLRNGLQAALGLAGGSIDDKDLVDAVGNAPRIRVSSAAFQSGTLEVVLHGESPAALPVGGFVRLVAVVPS